MPVQVLATSSVANIAPALPLIELVGMGEALY
jgi:hypothetical protein